MNTRKQSGTDNRKDCHRFCGTVDTCSPVLTEQKQNRTNERSSVTNTDPENEVNNRPAPIGRVVVTPDTRSGHQQVIHTCAQQAKQAQRDQQDHPPNHWWTFRIPYASSGIGDTFIVEATGYQRRTMRRVVERVVEFELFRVNCRHVKILFGS